ncbi:AzlC family ABC transporter permease, partial [Faecalibaculum rodentium]
MRAADRAGNSQSYAAGLRLGIPIALGYFSVSMAYGLSAVVLGFRPLQAALISISNLTSAGQFAGTQIIAQHGQLAELVLTTLVINARYFLMALSLSQKLEKTSLLQRLVMAYGITDEIFAAAIGESGKLSFSFMMGLITLPVIGW